MYAIQWIGNLVVGATPDQGQEGAESSQGAREEVNRIAAEIKERLDPISILANLALLKFKEIGSRITFSIDLKVYIQQPSEYSIMGVQEVLGVPFISAVRRVKGQSREDTDIIKKSIITAARWLQPHAQGNEVYKTFFQRAGEGLDSLISTYEKKTTPYSDGLKKWREIITEMTNKSPEQEAEQRPEIQKVRELWDKLDIETVNLLLQQMNNKQGDTPVSQEVKCSDEIKELEFKLDLKHARLKKIWWV
jgi:hypothetical protein